MKGKRVKVVLVDDHRIVLDGLVSLLESDADFIILAALGSGEEVLEFFKQEQPDILLTDYSLPGILVLSWRAPSKEIILKQK